MTEATSANAAPETNTDPGMVLVGQGALTDVSAHPSGISAAAAGFASIIGAPPSRARDLALVRFAKLLGDAEGTDVVVPMYFTGLSVTELLPELPEDATVVRDVATMRDEILAACENEHVEIYDTYRDSEEHQAYKEIYLMLHKERAAELKTPAEAVEVSGQDLITTGEAA